MARVLLENVTKVFDEMVRAVSDFSLEIADGEFMVIVGPSGCGKTTTLRMIAGLEKPTSGNIYLGDTLANNLAPRQRDVAMVFQNYALYPHMTVYQNMAFALKMRNFPKPHINKRIKEVASLLGIEQLLRRKPQALSGGQRQRVALGRAIVRDSHFAKRLQNGVPRNPKVFLFDEPLSNLDAALRVSTRAELKALHHGSQTTCIYVTHDQAEAMTLGDRICVMFNGTAQQTAGPMELYERPVNKFVAGFLGTPAMNFFTGCIKFQGDAVCFVFGNDTITLPQRMKMLLGDYRDSKMVLGVRPENLSPHPFSQHANNTISATVNIVEPLGTRTDVHLSTDTGTKFIVSVEPRIALKTNDAVKMHLDPEKVHIFEPGETAPNVMLSAAGQQA